VKGRGEVLGVMPDGLRAQASTVAMVVWLARRALAACRPARVAPGHPCRPARPAL